MRNVDAIRAAYETWHNTKGENRSIWLELVTNDFEMHSVGKCDPGLSFAGIKTGPALMDEYLRELIVQWEMKYYRVDAVFGDGDRVAMFGECSYDFRANGQNITTPIANLWTFRGAKAVRCIEIFDSAAVLRAASL